MAKAKIKKFYSNVSVKQEGPGFTVCLDGKSLKTPAKALVLVPGRELAEALAAEWRGQGDEIDLDTLEISRIVHTALDHVGQHREKIVAELTRFGQSDMICYRAEEPEALVQRQAEKWQPLLDWARDTLKAPLETGTGIQPVIQPPASLEALRHHIARHDDISLAALHQAVSLCGSLVIGLALSCGHLSEQAAWSAAQVDEDWQTEKWGHDDEAALRAENRKAALSVAALVLESCRL